MLPGLLGENLAGLLCYLEIQFLFPYVQPVPAV